MKKLITVTLSLVISTALFAQDAADKKVQAGLVTGFGVNFQKMGLDEIASNGLGTDLSIGMNVNFSFNESIGFCTGLEFDFETLKYRNATNYDVYYAYDGKDILSKEEAENSSTASVFQLDERKQKPVYLTIPTMLIFRTNYIGYFRYFGKFGLRNSFLLSQKSIDSGTDYANPLSPVETTKENMVNKNEMVFAKFAAGIAGGAEWNFTGSTCLVAEIGYYYGFVPLYYNQKNENDRSYVVYSSGSILNPSFRSNSAKQGQVMLKVSILF